MIVSHKGSVYTLCILFVVQKLLETPGNPVKCERQCENVSDGICMRSLLSASATNDVVAVRCGKIGRDIRFI